MKLLMWGQCLGAQFVLFWVLEFGAGVNSDELTLPQDVLQQQIEDIPSDVLEAFRKKGKDKPKQTNRPRHTGVSYIAPRGFIPNSECVGFSGCGSVPPELDFPPGHPSANNIENICLYGSKRPTYGQDSLPLTGMSHLRRQGNAINQIEAGFANCCLKPDKLKCAEEVWDSALKAFCEEEFAIKTRHYHCCKENKSSERAACFEKAAPSPNYDLRSSDVAATENKDEHVVEVTIEGPLCMMSADKCIKHIHMKGRKPTFPGISFPPGEPTHSNLKNICKLQKLRPRYTKASMRNVQVDAIRRQTAALNQVEHGYRMCCNGTDVLTCTKEKWNNVLKNFCKKETSIKTSWYPCCIDKPDRIMTCFSKAAPYPNYDREIQIIDVRTDINASHGNIFCGRFKLLSKEFPVSVLVQGIRKNCCHVMDDKIEQCIKNEKETLPETLCRRSDQSEVKSGKYWRRCCSERARETCFSERFLSKVTVAFPQKNNIV
ncbi:extracellular matrix protein 1 [Protopterus annectens]|uniref:extracellular matrix protein 1 n=1 Tax=Protopterus annectens TaxID=7888 RepID=UPI001CFA9DD5|nr:extracellular matrix protein 1 [Protopterus annectens]